MIGSDIQPATPELVRLQAELEEREREGNETAAVFLREQIAMLTSLVNKGDSIDVSVDAETGTVKIGNASTATDEENLKCGFCGGNLGFLEKDRSLGVEYRTCSKCGHEWSAEYFDYLRRQQRGDSTTGDQDTGAIINTIRNMSTPELEMAINRAGEGIFKQYAIAFLEERRKLKKAGKTDPRVGSVDSTVGDAPLVIPRVVQKVMDDLRESLRNAEAAAKDWLRLAGNTPAALEIARSINQALGNTVKSIAEYRIALKAEITTLNKDSKVSVDADTKRVKIAGDELKHAYAKCRKCGSDVTVTINTDIMKETCDATWRCPVCGPKFTGCKRMDQFLSDVKPW